jgi:flagellar biosynthesis/type III secretory pathway chaperone
MSTNKDLLKQAIAEAKTIREAAIANAKEALEETLTPHLKEMLALKLQEMEEEDNMEGIVNEEETINNPEGPTAHGNVAEAEEEEEEEAEEEEGEEAEEEEELEIEDMSVEDLKDLIRDIVSQEIGQEEMPEEMPGEKAPEGANDMVGMGDEEEIDINEILAELEEGSKKPKMVKEYGQAPESLVDVVDEYLVNSNMDPEGQLAELEEVLDYCNSKIAELSGGEIDEAKKSKMEGMKKPEMKEELEEALATVAELRGQLQEVNLLNAKLLYVNKVFKANNLTEGQKVNVVAAFDKAETVKEVKLVYETVSKNVSSQQPKQAIKEHKAFASKPAGTTKKQVINEVSEAVNRMQILAGIKQREF